MNDKFKYKEHFNKFIELMLKEDPTFQYTLDKIEELKKEMLVVPVFYLRMAKKYHSEAYDIVKMRLMMNKYKKEKSINLLFNHKTYKV